VTTPATCKFLAERHYWEWNWGELGYYQQAKDWADVPQLKAILEQIDSDEMYRYKDLLESFGSIMFAPRAPQKIKCSTLEKIAAGEGTAKSVALAHAILGAQHHIRNSSKFKVPSLEDLDEEPIGSALYLRWSAVDDTLRITDDFNYGAMNAGYNTTHSFGARGFQVSDIHEARAFVDYLKTMAKELEVVDRLVSAISEPYLEH